MNTKKTRKQHEKRMTIGSGQSLRKNGGSVLSSKKKGHFSRF